MPEDEEDREPDEVCENCGAEGDEGDLELDDNNVCETCRENEEAQRQLESDYRSWVL